LPKKIQLHLLPADLALQLGDPPLGLGPLSLGRRSGRIGWLGLNQLASDVAQRGLASAASVQGRLLHTADRRWVMAPNPAITFWEGETHEILPGLTLLRLGGHFAGGTVLHWAAGAGGAGALLSGDLVQVGPDTRGSFLRQ